MKRIAILINNLKIGGGAERAATLLAEGLKKQGHEPFVWLFDEAGEKYQYSGQLEVVKSRLPKNSFEALAAIFWRAREITKMCAEKNIRTIISFMEEANFASIAAKIFFGNKAKTICSVRNNPEKKKIVSRFLMKFFYPRADLLVANSLALEKIIKKFFIKIPLLGGGGEGKTAVIYNPVDYENIAVKAAEALLPEDEKIFSSEPVFINIGRLHRQKGQDVLLKAFNIVLEKNPQAKLAIIGDGEQKNNLEKLSEFLEIKDKVFFLGKRNNTFPLLKKSAVLVLSSRYEGLPNVLLEAMACGLPAVSTDCPTGPREILASDISLEEKLNYPFIAKNGILTAINDEKSLAEAMIMSLDLKRENKIDKRFLPDKIINDWEEIL